MIDAMAFNPVESLLLRVGDDFPRLSKASFVEGAVPLRITDIRYSLDLAGLPSSSWDGPEAATVISNLTS
jgi:hypothetical protein